MPVYPARELPIPGVGAEMIADRLTVKEKYILDATQIVDFVKEQRPRVLLTMGAGNIDRLAGPITDCLKELEL
jgi:UDP-N-acetylmuramate--alanine ligase